MDGERGLIYISLMSRSWHKQYEHEHNPSLRREVGFGNRQDIAVANYIAQCNCPRIVRGNNRCTETAKAPIECGGASEQPDSPLLCAAFVPFVHNDPPASYLEGNTKRLRDAPVAAPYQREPVDRPVSGDVQNVTKAPSNAFA